MIYSQENLMYRKIDTGWKDINHSYSPKILSKCFQRGLQYLPCLSLMFSVNALYLWFLHKILNKWKIVRYPCLNQFHKLHFCTESAQLLSFRRFRRLHRYKNKMSTYRQTLYVASLTYRELCNKLSYLQCNLLCFGRTKQLSVLWPRECRVT